MILSEKYDRLKKKNAAYAAVKYVSDGSAMYTSIKKYFITICVSTMISRFFNRTNFKKILIII